MGLSIAQIFPPAAKLTEKNLPDQSGKVFIVTGSTSGVGQELAQILYGANAKVYLAARSASKAASTISTLQAAHPTSTGTLIHLPLDLSDLSTIKASASQFLAAEPRLDVLFNNAGVMVPPQGSTTKQGYEMQLGVNNLAPFLFTKMLLPALRNAVKEKGKGGARIVWTSSSMAELSSPQGGVDMGNLDYKVDKKAWEKYGTSKAGNVLHAKEFARREGGEGIISVAVDPGNLKTDLQRHMPSWQTFMMNLILHTPIHGAYTELFGGLSPDVTLEKNGAWIAPWGRFVTLRKDIEASSKTKEDGGTGVGEEFYKWSEEQVRTFE